MSNRNLRAIIVGALYDFAAALTVRKDAITAGSNHNAAPMAEAVAAFVKERDVDGTSDPLVREWRERLKLEEAVESINDEPTALCFKEDLARCINRWSKDTDYGMPDFVLALLVEQMLDAVGRANASTERFVGGSIADRVAAEYDPDSITFLGGMGNMGNTLDIDLGSIADERGGGTVTLTLTKDKP